MSGLIYTSSKFNIILTVNCFTIKIKTITYGKTMNSSTKKLFTLRFIEQILDISFHNKINARKAESIPLCISNKVRIHPMSRICAFKELQRSKIKCCHLTGIQPTGG